MPSQLQLHPVKLKCKLEYKSHYMYDMIHRDHVISAITGSKEHNSYYTDIKLNEHWYAITWLKEHNSHYTDIKLNEHWYSDIASRELSVQLDESDNCITLNEHSVLKQSLKKENISKEK